MVFKETPENFNPQEPDYTLHWAEVSYSEGSTQNRPIDLGPDGRRLDVVFTDEQQQMPGCWISIPIALRGGLNNNQAYLPPGDYIVEISVTCRNGKGDTRSFKIRSPQAWQDLQMVRLEENFAPEQTGYMGAISTSVSTGTTTISGTGGTAGTSGTSITS